MYKLKYSLDDELMTKVFSTKEELDSYVEQKNIKSTWHQIEKIKAVIPNEI